MSPVAVITSITRLEDLTEYWIKRLEDHAEDLGFKFIGAYDDKITTAYPAVIVGSGNQNKTVHGTHTFLVQMNIDFYVLHAEATLSHRRRSLEMLQLTTKLVDFLEADKTLGDKIIFGYVLTERPGLIQPRTNPGVFIVSTLINYQATLEVRF